MRGEFLEGLDGLWSLIEPRYREELFRYPGIGRQNHSLTTFGESLFDLRG